MAGLTTAMLLGVALTGCPGEQNDVKDPTKLALERRDTEMTHEDCDIESSGAKKMDANGDGRPDLVQVMSGNREECRAVDINMDGNIDVFVYYDGQGQVRRRESGFDRDTRPDEISHFQGGVLVRKERETNNDSKIDTWDYYEAGRLVREERDSTGDGYVDQWWTFNRPGQPQCAVVVSDEDGDGKPDEGSEIDLCKDQVPAPPEPDDKPKDDGASDGDAPADGSGGSEPEGPASDDSPAGDGAAPAADDKTAPPGG
jgi:hypothetical protein